MKQFYINGNQQKNIRRIAVLGSSGQVGSIIGRTLCRIFPEAEILACVRSPKGSQDLPLPENWREVVFDPFEEEWKKLGALDLLVNSIGIIEETDTFTFKEMHVGITRKILKHRLEIGNPAIIQVSVLGADESLASPFMHTKAQADRELLSEERTWVVKPSIVCTHNTMMVKELKMIRSISRFSLKRLFFPKRLARTRMQPVMSEDVAEVIANIARNGSGVHSVPVTGPEVFLLSELIRICDPEIRILPFPEPIFRGVFSIASAVFPRLLKREQFNLLGTDNIAPREEAEKFLGRDMRSTREFWKNELK